MPDIVKIATWEGFAFLFALFGVIALRLLTGAIPTRGLIEGSTRRGSHFVSAARVQMLIATMAAAAQYLAQVWGNPQKLPEVPTNWLLLLGGSHLIYLGNKFHGKRNHHFQI